MSLSDADKQFIRERAIRRTVTKTFMKKAICTFLLIFVASFGIFAQQTSKTIISISKEKQVEREKFDPLRNPAEDLQAAVKKAEAENKRIILDVGGEWCVWCVWMDKYFIKNPDLAKLRDENFVWVKVNMSPENENRAFLSKYPLAAGYPHLYVLEKDGKLLYSQNTAELEEEKSYNLQKFTGFLEKWSPAKNKTKSKK